MLLLDKTQVLLFRDTGRQDYGSCGEPVALHFTLRALTCPSMEGVWGPSWKALNLQWPVAVAVASCLLVMSGIHLLVLVYMGPFKSVSVSVDA